MSKVPREQFLTPKARRRMKHHRRLEQLEARIDEMVSAIDWWRKECVRREEEAFSAGWTCATADVKRGCRTGEYVITQFRKWKHRLIGLDLSVATSQEDTEA